MRNAHMLLSVYPRVLDSIADATSLVYDIEFSLHEDRPDFTALVELEKNLLGKGAYSSDERCVVMLSLNVKGQRKTTFFQSGCLVGLMHTIKGDKIFTGGSGPLCI